MLSHQASTELNSTGMIHGSTLRPFFNFFLFCCLLAPLSLLAQRPTPVNLPDTPKGWEPSLLKMECNDAGEINRFSGFQMESTSFGDNLSILDIRPYSSRPDTIFLCSQDLFTVSLLGGSTDLSGDPNPATTAGVGYAFYRCEPTVSGPTLTDIANDACVADNGLSPFDQLAVAIPPNYLSGDYTLTVANDGSGNNTIPALFPVLGQPTPIVLTLAPITFDHVDNNGLAFYEGTPIGECVDVSIDQTFTVAYLNPVNLANLGVNPTNACEGSFDVRGGTPELLGGTGYEIIIENTVSGARAVVTTPEQDIIHNAVIQYIVPEAGEYRITILDQNSCPLEETLINHFSGCELPLIFDFPYATGLMGTNICVPITVENFTDITAFQFQIGFDPAVLQFTSLTNINGNLTGGILSNGPPSSPGGTLPDGNIRIIYSDNFAGPTTLPADAIIFELCFDLIGPINSQSTLVCLPEEPGISITPEFTRVGPVTSELNCNHGAITITDQAFLLELSRENERCDGEDNGRIIAEASGGPDPFIFSIRRVSPNPQAVFGNDQTRTGQPSVAEFSGLQDGFYEIRAEAANGDVVIMEIEIEAGPEVDVNLDVFRQPSCNGFDDGIMVAMVFANGVQVTDPIAEGYTFAWENSAESTDTLRGLISGSYEVTVTSPGSCVSSDSHNLPQPADVRVRPDNPSDAVSNATCSGAPDGSITITADGGTGPYDFNWQTVGLGDDVDVVMSFRDNLLPGEYAVIATDTRGCSDTSNFVVNANKMLDIVSEVDSVLCFGDANGVIRVNGTATGAAPVGNYFVSLENLTTTVTGAETEIVDNSIPFEFTGLDVGQYVVFLRDNDPAGCTTTDTFEIFQPVLLEVTDLDIQNETCIVGMDGTATATVTGGTMPYEFRWVNDSLTAPMDTITPGDMLTALSADTNYFLIVTDGNGCMDTAFFRINAPASAVLSVIDTSFVSCPGDTDGQLTVVATPPMGETITSIIWYRLNADGTLDAPVANLATTQANLPVGNYAVEVITSNSCIIFGAGVVSSPGEVFLQDFTANDPQCPGDANGSIFVNPGGGTPNTNGTYNYVISTPMNPLGDPPTTNPAFTNLVAGSYTISIVDGNACLPSFDTTFVLSDPPSITGTFALTNVSCPDDMIMDGTATFTAEFSDGTQGVYDFLWTSGTPDFNTTMSTETGLPRGPVTVVVTDGVCTESFTDTIRSPDEFNVELMTSDVSCNGLTDGAASVVVTGGTMGYDYVWSASTDNDNMIDGLAAGTSLTLDITDANGCSPTTETFIIRQPDPLTLMIDPVATTESVRCAGDANGRISVFISSVNNNDLSASPYSWSGNVAGPNEVTATDLQPGTYGITVTDVEGCQDSISYTIGEPEAIIFNVLPIEEPLCFGETTPVLIDTAFGGTSSGIEDFTFSVNNDGFLIPVDREGNAFAGDVVVTVFDSVGCSASQTFSVNQPPQIIIDLPEEIIIELGDSLTRLNPLISPAGDVYEYLWMPPDFLSSDTVRNPLIFPFEDTDYNFRVTNANGCQAFANIFVEVDANRNVYIPNVFSPNRDGRNEDFRIFACQGVDRVIDVKIFNRWGGIVYENMDLAPNCLDGIKLWEGEGKNGKPVNPGVFVYVIEVEFLDNVKLLYRGDVTVLR